MDTPIHPASGLLKAVWSQADYPVMSWRGCRIHAVGIGDYELRSEFLEFDDLDDTLPRGRLLVDLDYVVRAVPPAVPNRGFSFWVSPATLVFDHAVDITAAIGPIGVPLQIENLHRLERPDRPAERRWHIEGKGFDIRFEAFGYQQYLRMPPQHGYRELTERERGGISFTQRAFAD